MPTIGRHYQGPQYNHTDFCDICGCPWHRTDLFLDADGWLRCPNDRDGLSYVEMADISAQAVGEIEPLRGKTREMP
jgi:hypothetical protein